MSAHSNLGRIHEGVLVGAIARLAAECRQTRDGHGLGPSMGWVGLGWVGLGWVGSEIFHLDMGWVGLGWVEPTGVPNFCCEIVPV
jgi:hypothetical protein